jgi:hypothetical protein
MKIALQDVSLIKQEGPKWAPEKIIAGKLIVVLTNTSNEDSKVE